MHVLRSGAATAVTTATSALFNSELLRKKKTKQKQGKNKEENKWEKTVKRGRKLKKTGRKHNFLRRSDFTS
jgi:hypothetical protein